MSRVREGLIRKLVRELIRQELDEANSTSSVGGSYNTPHAFGGSNKKGKGKGKAGYTGGHDEPTDGTGHFIAKDPKLRKTESINEAYKVHAKSKLGIGPKKWELEKFLTGGKSFDYKKGMEIVKKLRRMSSSINYKLIKESVNEGKLNEFMYAKLGSKVEKFVKQYYGKNKFVSLPAWKVTMTYPDQPGRTHDQWVKAKSAKDAIQISKKMWSNQNIKVGKAIFDDEHWLGVQKAQKTGFTEGEIKIKKESVNEGRYHAWRNDDSLSPKQKIGIAMRETRDSLKELERVVRYNVKLKNELKVDSRDYWKNTHKALNKISERLVKLANKVGQLH